MKYPICADACGIPVRAVEWTGENIDQIRWIVPHGYKAETRGNILLLKDTVRKCDWYIEPGRYVVKDGWLAYGASDDTIRCQQPMTEVTGL